LDAFHVEFPDKNGQKIVNHIDYSAEGKRNLIKYGNKTQTSYSYEDTTHRLLAIKTTRPAAPESNPVIQDVEYFYDPAGNITRTRDRSIPTVFSKNQQIEPVFDYTYDALYRLIKATGRQHQGINGNMFKNNINDGSFKQCYGPPLLINDADKLEIYTENFTYDDSTNLVKKQHIALSGSWVKETYTEDDSNRLKDHAYDASGNLKKLEINNRVNLSYNCCENMVKAAVIERPDEPDDSDYYLYDSGDCRMRKVSERMVNGGNSMQVEDKIYLGNYEIKKNYSISWDHTVNLKSERNTLRIMDDKTCVAIIHYFTTDQQNPEKENVMQSRFQLGNYLGSVSLETDANAQIITYEEYFPYGGSAIITGSSQSEVNLKEYRYAGKECDDSTGLYYYGARYYAPWLGRWLIPDPEGGKDGLNVYSFVGGNPVTATDHEGRWKYVPFVGGAISTGVTTYKIASSKGYTGWKLAGLTFGGGAFGGTVGVLGDLISASCLPMSQTLSMAFTSTVTSGVLSYFSGGSVNITTNFGVANYNWSKQTATYPFKTGNTLGQNATLLANFATTNLSDLLSLKGGGTNVELVTEHSDMIGHSAIVGDGITISVGPTKVFYDMSNPKSLIKSLPVRIPGKAWQTYHTNATGHIGWHIPIYNVQKNTLHEISQLIVNNTNTTVDRLPYSGLTASCVGYTGDALLKTGVPTLGALSLHPFLLHGMVGGRQLALQFMPYQTLKVNPPHHHTD
jgi:RHS repeat-associated protein